MTGGKGRQLRLLSMVLAASLGVAACGSSSSSSSSTTQSVSGTLTIWDNAYFPTDNGPGLKAIDKAFEQKYPDVKIDHVGVPYDQFFQKLRAAIAAKQGPDVVTLYPGLFAADYEQGLQPLDDLLTPQVKRDTTLLDISRAPDGHTYAVPFTVYGFVYYGNKELLSQAGIDTPPTTWSDLLADCGKLKSAGIPAISGAWKDGYLLDWFQYIYGDMLLDPAATAEITAAKLPFNDPRMVQALSLAQQMDKAGCFAPGSDDRTLQDMDDQFTAGKAAMLLDVGLPDRITTFAKGIGIENVEVFAPPMVPGSAYTSQLIDVGPNSGYGITKWTKNAAAARAYVSFLLSSQAQGIMWKVNHRLPNNTTVKMSGSNPAENQLFHLLGLPDNHTIYLAIPASVSAVLERQAASVVHGSTSAQSAADQMEQAMGQLRPKYQK
jgi:ABC-type glycerol-3-phosphate transport system substrate-binding protein